MVHDIIFAGTFHLINNIVIQIFLYIYFNLKQYRAIQYKPNNLFTHLNETGTADQLFGVHNINQGFFNCHLFDARHIKAIHVLPP